VSFQTSTNLGAGALHGMYTDLQIGDRVTIQDAGHEFRGHTGTILVMRHPRLRLSAEERSDPNLFHERMRNEASVDVQVDNGFIVNVRMRCLNRLDSNDRRNDR
tara:strand:- start:3240 stop:3551 length:312 start_codon:yes stop_codon:yes gene_type:complete